MKNFLATLLALCLVQMISAQQSGVIKYTETVKLDIKLPDGIEMPNMMKSMSSKKILNFDKSISLYKEDKGNESKDQEISSDDGSFKMVIMMDDNEEIYYTDLKEKMSLHQTGIMGKAFLIEEAVEKRQWKVTAEKVKYLDYVCQKATATIVDGDKEEEIVAWFTTEIPVSIGPDDYNQLPGAILMISVDDGKKEIKATEVTIKTLEEEAIAKPTKGKKVTAEEYKRITEEKIKEMEEMYQVKKDN